jgi:hypothetical protein
MHAAAVDVLVQKGKFELQAAMAVAEAITVEISSSQLVTVPILDARFAEADANMNVRFAEADARMSARFAEADAEMSARFAECYAKMDVRFAAVDARFDIQEARFDVKLQEMRTDLQRMKTDLVFWIVTVTVGSAYLPKLLALLTEVIRAR